MKKKSIIISIAVVLVLFVVVFFYMNMGKKEVQFVTAMVQNDTIENIVTATGYVQPVDKVDVGTQVSGVIEKIYVDYNSQVKKGQLLAELDKSTLSEKLTQADASLSSATSDLTFAQQNYDRVKKLYDVKAATEASFEEATNNLTQAKTSLANAKANVHQAKVNLAYAEIYSPINGVILNRAVEQGQTVAASFNTPTLFTIANDLKKMQVEADVDEADIGQVQLGQKVNFTVDAYPDNTFEGTVNQLRLQPTVTSNVVTYTVIIEAPNPDEKLFPGMTASVSIITKTASGLSIPSEALHFNPAPEIVTQMGMKAPQENKDFSPLNKGVWIKTRDGIVHRALKVGLTDGVHTIVEDGLHVGDTIILSVAIEKKEKSQGEAAVNPLMPRRPGRR